MHISTVWVLMCMRDRWTGESQRWLTSITNILLEKGVIGVAELGEAVEAARGRHAAAVAAAREC